MAPPKRQSPLDEILFWVCLVHLIQTHNKNASSCTTLTPHPRRLGASFPGAAVCLLPQSLQRGAWGEHDPPKLHVSRMTSSAELTSALRLLGSLDIGLYMAASSGPLGLQEVLNICCSPAGVKASLQFGCERCAKSRVGLCQSRGHQSMSFKL